MDTAAYQIVNGDGKLRMLITGALGKQAKWRTLVLSTGEVGLIDLLEEIGKKPAAGQLVRIVEIPLTEKYG
ncbi:helicase, partial [Escherichia coli]|nr:helicase [Escherichia coli]